MASLGRGRRRDQNLTELRPVTNHMVRRQNGHDGVGVESRESRHCQRDRRGVATGVRLNHEMVGPKVG